MKRLYIIVEGQTEKEFVEKSLTEYFNFYNIFDIRAIMIKTNNGHKGGFVEYKHLKNDLNKILTSEKNIFVSMFVDYFRLPKSFPKYKESLEKTNIDDRIEVLLQGISEDINDLRFIPYIQKHEFESLLFSSEKGFCEWFDDSNVIKDLTKIVRQHENPEEINSGAETAPSKRIINILYKYEQIYYDKIAEGNLIAEGIGIHRILGKCPRFKDWIDILIKKMINNQQD